ncbi:MAG: hypothetical protein HQL30_07675, partial [Candidatus Omnitrophica bacterium]|nr:hypothetical protein [Candidatus Omnitrophota bacterium]
LTTEGIFERIRDKGAEKYNVPALAAKVEIGINSFPTLEEQYRISRLVDGGKKLLLHPGFIEDIKDLRNARLKFGYAFGDGKTRVIDLADSICYRAAMHEFDLRDRDGEGHVHYGEDGAVKMRYGAESELMANLVGRRYSVVDDAMWLWFLHSYLASDGIRYDNDVFERRLRLWLFVDGELVGKMRNTERKEKLLEARGEFPALINDPGRREEAIKLALLINKQYFERRWKAGVDTTPAYEKYEFDSSDIFGEMPGIDASSQIGKRAKAVQLREEDGVKYFTIVSTEPAGEPEGHKVLKEKVELFPADTARDLPVIKPVLEALIARHPEHERILNIFLKLLLNSPPEFYEFGETSGDLFGFTAEQNNIVCLYCDYKEKPVLLFHEVLEYLQKKGLILISSDRKKITVIFSEVPGVQADESVDIDVSSGLFSGLETESWWVDTGGRIKGLSKEARSDDEHYYSRVFQREAFGDEDIDFSRYLHLSRVEELTEGTRYAGLFKTLKGYIERLPPRGYHDLIRRGHFGFSLPRTKVKDLMNNPLALFAFMLDRLIDDRYVNVRLETSNVSGSADMVIDIDGAESGRIKAVPFGAFEKYEWWDKEKKNVRKEHFSRKDGVYLLEAVFGMIFTSDAAGEFIGKAFVKDREVYTYVHASMGSISDKDDPYEDEYEISEFPDKSQKDRNTKPADLDKYGYLVAEVPVSKHGYLSVYGEPVYHADDHRGRRVLVEYKDGAKYRVFYLEDDGEHGRKIKLLRNFLALDIYRDSELFDEWGLRLARGNEGNERKSRVYKKDLGAIFANSAKGSLYIGTTVPANGTLTMGGGHLMENDQSAKGRRVLVQILGVDENEYRAKIYIRKEEPNAEERDERNDEQVVWELYKDETVVETKESEKKEGTARTRRNARGPAWGAESEKKHRPDGDENGSGLLAVDSENGNGHPGEKNYNFLKGWIFEELVWRLYVSVYGARENGGVEFNKVFPVNAFTTDIRYPDLFRRGMFFADTKWGLLVEDVVETVKKYKRLMKMHSREDIRGMNIPSIERLWNLNIKDRNGRLVIGENYRLPDKLTIILRDPGKLNEIKAQLGEDLLRNVEFVTVGQVVKQLMKIKRDQASGAAGKNLLAKYNLSEINGKSAVDILADALPRMKERIPSATRFGAIKKAEREKMARQTAQEEYVLEVDALMEEFTAMKDELDSTLKWLDARLAGLSNGKEAKDKVLEEMNDKVKELRAKRAELERAAGIVKWPHEGSITIDRPADWQKRLKEYFIDKTDSEGKHSELITAMKILVLSHEAYYESAHHDRIKAFVSYVCQEMDIDPSGAVRVQEDRDRAEIQELIMALNSRAIYDGEITKNAWRSLVDRYKNPKDNGKGRNGTGGIGTKNAAGEIAGDKETGMEEDRDEVVEDGNPEKDMPGEVTYILRPVEEVFFGDDFAEINDDLADGTATTLYDDLLGVYQAPEEGYVRLVSDDVIMEFSALAEEAGFGFLLDRDIGHSRLRKKIETVEAGRIMEYVNVGTDRRPLRGEGEETRIAGKIVTYDIAIKDPREEYLNYEHALDEIIENASMRDKIVYDLYRGMGSIILEALRAKAQNGDMRATGLIYRLNSAAERVKVKDRGMVSDQKEGSGDIDKVRKGQDAFMGGFFPLYALRDDGIMLKVRAAKREYTRISDEEAKLFEEIRDLLEDEYESHGYAFRISEKITGEATNEAKRKSETEASAEGPGVSGEEESGKYPFSPAPAVFGGVPFGSDSDYGDLEEPLKADIAGSVTFAGGKYSREEGWQRTVPDGVVGEISDLVNNAGFGFLFEKDMAYSRAKKKGEGADRKQLIFGSAVYAEEFGKEEDGSGRELNKFVFYDYDKAAFDAYYRRIVENNIYGDEPIINPKKAKRAGTRDDGFTSEAYNIIIKYKVLMNIGETIYNMLVRKGNRGDIAAFLLVSEISGIFAKGINKRREGWYDVEGVEQRELFSKAFAFHLDPSLSEWIDGPVNTGILPLPGKVRDFLSSERDSYGSAFFLLSQESRARELRDTIDRGILEYVNVMKKTPRLEQQLNRILKGLGSVSGERQRVISVFIKKNQTFESFSALKAELVKVMTEGGANRLLNVLETTREVRSFIVRVAGESLKVPKNGSAGTSMSGPQEEAPKLKPAPVIFAGSDFARDDSYGADSAARLNVLGSVIVEQIRYDEKSNSYPPLEGYKRPVSDETVRAVSDLVDKSGFGVFLDKAIAFTRAKGKGYRGSGVNKDYQGLFTLIGEQEPVYGQSEFKRHMIKLNLLDYPDEVFYELFTVDNLSAGIPFFNGNVYKGNLIKGTPRSLEDYARFELLREIGETLSRLTVNDSVDLRKHQLLVNIMLEYRKARQKHNIPETPGGMEMFVGICFAAYADPSLLELIDMPAGMTNVFRRMSEFVRREYAGEKYFISRPKTKDAEFMAVDEVFNGAFVKLVNNTPKDRLEILLNQALKTQCPGYGNASLRHDMVELILRKKPFASFREFRDVFKCYDHNDLPFLVWHLTGGDQIWQYMPENPGRVDYDKLREKTGKRRGQEGSVYPAMAPARTLFSGTDFAADDNFGNMTAEIGALGLETVPFDAAKGGYEECRSGYVRVVSDGEIENIAALMSGAGFGAVLDHDMGFARVEKNNPGTGPVQGFSNIALLAGEAPDGGKFWVDGKLILYDCVRDVYEAIVGKLYGGSGYVGHLVNVKAVRGRPETEKKAFETWVRYELLYQAGGAVYSVLSQKASRGGERAGKLTRKAFQLAVKRFADTPGIRRRDWYSWPKSVRERDEFLGVFIRAVFPVFVDPALKIDTGAISPEEKVFFKELAEFYRDEAREHGRAFYLPLKGELTGPEQIKAIGSTLTDFLNGHAPDRVAKLYEAIKEIKGSGDEAKRRDAVMKLCVNGPYSGIDGISRKSGLTEDVLVELTFRAIDKGIIVPWQSALEQENPEDGGGAGTGDLFLPAPVLYKGIPLGADTNYGTGGEINPLIEGPVVFDGKYNDPEPGYKRLMSDGTLREVWAKVEGKGFGPILRKVIGYSRVKAADRKEVCLSSISVVKDAVSSPGKPQEERAIAKLILYDLVEGRYDGLVNTLGTNPGSLLTGLGFKEIITDVPPDLVSFVKYKAFTDIARVLEVFLDDPRNRKGLKLARKLYFEFGKVAEQGGFDVARAREYFTTAFAAYADPDLASWIKVPLSMTRFLDELAAFIRENYRDEEYLKYEEFTAEKRAEVNACFAKAVVDYLNKTPEDKLKAGLKPILKQVAPVFESAGERDKVINDIITKRRTPFTGIEDAKRRLPKFQGNEFVMTLMALEGSRLIDPYLVFPGDEASRPGSRGQEPVLLRQGFGGHATYDIRPAPAVFEGMPFAEDGNYGDSHDEVQKRVSGVIGYENGTYEGPEEGYVRIIGDEELRMASGLFKKAGLDFLFDKDMGFLRVKKDANTGSTADVVIGTAGTDQMSPENGRSRKLYKFMLCDYPRDLHLKNYEDFLAKHVYSERPFFSAGIVSKPAAKDPVFEKEAYAAINRMNLLSNIGVAVFLSMGRKARSGNMEAMIFGQKAVEEYLESAGKSHSSDMKKEWPNVTQYFNKCFALYVDRSLEKWYGKLPERMEKLIRDEAGFLEEEYKENGHSLGYIEGADRRDALNERIERAIADCLREAPKERLKNELINGVLRGVFKGKGAEKRRPRIASEIIENRGSWEGMSIKRISQDLSMDQNEFSLFIRVMTVSDILTPYLMDDEEEFKGFLLRPAPAVFEGGPFAGMPGFDTKTGRYGPVSTEYFRVWGDKEIFGLSRLFKDSGFGFLLDKDIAYTRVNEPPKGKAFVLSTCQKHESRPVSGGSRPRYMIELVLSDLEKTVWKIFNDFYKSGDKAIDEIFSSGIIKKRPDEIKDQLRYGIIEEVGEKIFEIMEIRSEKGDVMAARCAKKAAKEFRRYFRGERIKGDGRQLLRKFFGIAFAAEIDPSLGSWISVPPGMKELVEEVKGYLQKEYARTGTAFPIAEREEPVSRGKMNAVFSDAVAAYLNTAREEDLAETLRVALPGVHPRLMADEGLISRVIAAIVRERSEKQFAGIKDFTERIRDLRHGELVDLIDILATREEVIPYLETTVTSEQPATLTTQLFFPGMGPEESAPPADMPEKSDKVKTPGLPGQTAARQTQLLLPGMGPNEEVTGPVVYEHKKETAAVQTADAGGGGTYRNYGPGGKNYRETGELYRIALDGFIDSSRDFLPRVIGSGRKPVVIRVPVEELDLIGEENARDFLTAFKPGNGSNLKLALYSSNGRGSVTDRDYARYGMTREEFDIVPSRSNTVTLFITGKDEDLGSNIDMMERIGMMDPEDTILIPVGMYDEGKDMAGLIRSTLLGLRLVHIANGEYNKTFIGETIDTLGDLAGVSTISGFDLDEKDIMALVRSDYNKVRFALDKLKKILPIIPLDEEELRRVYQYDKEAMLAA